MQVASGGVLSSATVSSGGTLAVFSGGFAELTAIQSGGAVIISGGTADLQSGTTVSGPITFAAAGGTLEVGGKSLSFMSGLVISGLATGDTIDLANVTFSAGATASASGGFLDVTVGGTTYALGLGSPTSFPGDNSRSPATVTAAPTLLS